MARSNDHIDESRFIYNEKSTLLDEVVIRNVKIPMDSDQRLHIKPLNDEDLKNRKNPCFDGNKIIDYVLAYKDDVGLNTSKRDDYLRNLQNAGLELRLHDPSNTKKFEEESNKSGNESIIYILVHTPADKLLEAAEKTRFKVPIQVNNLEKTSLISSFWHRIPNPFKLPEKSTKKNDRKYFTAPYDSKIKAKFEAFWEIEDLGKFDDFIASKDRSLLAYEFLSRTSYYSKKEQHQLEIEEKKSLGNSIVPDVDYIGIERLLENGVFLAAYPLHEYYEKNGKYTVDSQNRQYLWEFWAKPKNIFSYQPLYDIRQYFGEKVAFYFSWLGFYTTWLLIPSIIGFLVFIYGLLTLPYDIPTNEICDKSSVGNITMCPLCKKEACDFWYLSDSCLYSKITHVFDNGGTVFFSIVMALWTVLFIEFWKRQQNTYRFEWDTIDYENKYDVIRPEYERKIPQMPKHEITGEPIIPFSKRLTKYVMSWSVVLFAILLVLAILLGMIVYRFSVYIALRRYSYWRPLSSYISSASAACINLIFILILNRVYTWCAVKLTDIELHRTDSEYESAFTIKMYLFQFFNYYSSIFYIAFIKGSRFKGFEIEPCDPSGCLTELCIQLAIIMVGKQIINNVQEYLYPYIMKLINRPCCKNVNRREKTSLMQWEKDFRLLPWNTMSLFDEYLEMVIQFGFITLFVVAFPIAPLFAFLNNILEVRIDAHKFLVQMRRPLAKKARDIGIWLDILNSVSKIGVITNGLIIAFTSEFIPRLVYLISREKSDLSGFVNYTLSLKLETVIKDGVNTTIPCSFRDFREPPESINYGKSSIEFYHVNVARLAFIVVFEHLIFFIVACLHWIIQDVPKVIKHQIERENTIIQNAIWTKGADEYIISKAIIDIRHQNKNNSTDSIVKEKKNRF